MTHIKDTFKLNCAATLPNRLVMAQMVTQASTVDGFITQKDLDYFEIRSNVAGMIITGEAAVEDGGRGFDKQIVVSSDAHVKGLTKFATTIKKDGDKAIMQLYHGGREVVGGYNLFHEVVAPSAIDFPFLPYVPRELTEDEILRIVKSVVKAHAKEDFIVGFRFCPEEIHGENIGFTLEDSIAWMDRVVEIGVDYIHISIFTGFTDKAVNASKSYGETFKARFNDITAVIIVSNVLNLKDANETLKHGDLVAIGQGALVEPDFAGKIMRDEANTIVTRVTNDNFNDLKWPEGLSAWFFEEGNPLPPVTGFSDL